ncbi:hypothetical protein ACQKKX_15565 [Neorhizobium sp. NPDC001467]|uniref:hypothetical protein n=1 Tax=Neorhizobium sp. NPDC001467 TaxID=3390595 RepID=UPI003CFFE669
MMRHPVLLMVLGFVVWSGAFLGIYFTQATACSLAMQSQFLHASAGAFRLVLIGIVLAAIVAVIAVYRFQRQSPELSGDTRTSDFLKGVTTRVSVAALFSTAFCFIGVFWLTLCAA